MSTIKNRQDKLMALVAVFPLKVTTIARMLEVSVNTIYRDIDYLVSKNKINIEHSVSGAEVSAL